MARRLLLGLALVALLLSPAPAAAEMTLPDGFSEVTLASGLFDPTALAYAPDGRLFVAEKAGRLRVISPGGTLAATPVIDIRSHVASQGDRGLLGLAVDAAFATNRYVYLLYAHETDASQPSAAKTARLTRITVNQDNTVAMPLAPETVLLGKHGTAPCPPPSDTSDCIPSTSNSHSIGTVRSDADGTLWVGSGDGAGYNAMDPAALRSYDERSLAGKLLHIDRNGRGLPGHHFCPEVNDLDRVCTKLHAKGFRNPFRFHLRAGSTPVVGDVGWGLTEELDFVEPGKSYGWPCYEGATRTADYQELPECQALYEAPPSQTPPVHSYPHPPGSGGAVVAGPQYTGSRYPAEYRGAWFFGDYVQGWLKYYDVVDGKVEDVRTFAAEGFDGVDLATSPEGDLVYLRIISDGFDSGRVVRIVHGNAPPPAVAHASPRTGPSPLAVTLSADESIDPDGDAVSYAWDVDGDGVQDATGRTVEHEYDTGAYTATLTVRDARGLASQDAVEVAVDVTPPVASIDTPADGSLFRHGTTVEMRGSATDADDGALSGSALTWRIVLHHGSHIHLVMSGDSGAEQTFLPPGDHDADSYYVIQLTAKDASGLTDTEQVEIRPETVALSLASSPAGALLTYAGRQYLAPARLTAAIGHRTSVAAPETVSASGMTYRFAGWSDGGARQHPIVVPAANSTLTARYAIDAPAPASPVPPAASELVGPTRAAPPRAARLRLDRLARRPRTLSGSVGFVSARPRVLVALRTARSGGACRHWSQVRGRLGRPVARCRTHLAWMRAVVKRTAGGSWKWRVALGGRPAAGRYVLTTRVASGRGKPLLRARSVPLRVR